MGILPRVDFPFDEEFGTSSGWQQQEACFAGLVNHKEEVAEIGT